VPSLKTPRGLLPVYSDLLLHDLGPELSDGVLVGDAKPAELRTAPLWAIALTPPYLHDGRADTIDQAILAHGGEAASAQKAYAALPDPERQAVLSFLTAIGGGGGGGGGASTSAAAPEERGRKLFDHDFAVSEGLGPFFNADSCRACHLNPDLGGAGPADVDVVRQGARLSISVASLLPSNLPPVLPPTDAPVMVPRHVLAGRARPALSRQANVFERRQTPTTFGLGLIDSVSESAILANADPEDANRDGISGRARVLPDGRLGRFGWKANFATLADFTVDALANELGLTVPEALTHANGRRIGASQDDDGVADPEVPGPDVQALTLFMATLPAPARRPVNAEAETRGAVLFSTFSCAQCHRPSLKASSGEVVPLYSDLLLHDVVPPQVGVIREDEAGRELRTPPLWGIRDTAPYLHDGRAETLDAAIRGHDLEALSSRRAYESASDGERADLVAFLQSL
jgi:CxxC motif-containing protein (DUF1111 family)